MGGQYFNFCYVVRSSFIFSIRVRPQVLDTILDEVCHDTVSLCVNMLSQLPATCVVHVHSGFPI